MTRKFAFVNNCLLLFLIFLQYSCFFDIFSDDFNEIQIVENICLANPEGYDGKYLLIENKGNGNFEILIEEQIIAVTFNTSRILVTTKLNNELNYFLIDLKEAKNKVVEKITRSQFDNLIVECDKCKTVKSPRL